MGTTVHDNMSNKTLQVKITVVGNTQVGKTFLLFSYTDDKFSVRDNVPSRFDSYAENIRLDDREVHLMLSDSEGSDDYARLRPLAYQKTTVFLICFSLVSPYSFKNVKKNWLPELTHFCPGVPVLLVGTKLDLRDDPKTLADLKEKDQEPISYSTGSELAREIGAAKYLECSALTQEGVKTVFDEAIKTAIDVIEKQNAKKPKPCVLY